LQLFIDGVVIREKGHAEAVPESGDGRVLHRHGEFVIQNEQETTDEIKRNEEEIHTSPRKGLVL
jgi:hypothetical protein